MMLVGCQVSKGNTWQYQLQIHITYVSDVLNKYIYIYIFNKYQKIIKHNIVYILRCLRCLSVLRLFQHETYLVGKLTEDWLRPHHPNHPPCCGASSSRCRWASASLSRSWRTCMASRWDAGTKVHGFHEG